MKQASASVLFPKCGMQSGERPSVKQSCGSGCVCHLCMDSRFPGLVGWSRIAQLVADVGNLCGSEAIRGKPKALTPRDETHTERDMRLKLQTGTDALRRANTHTRVKQKHGCEQQLLTCGWLPADQTLTESPSSLWRKRLGFFTTTTFVIFTCTAECRLTSRWICPKMCHSENVLSTAALFKIFSWYFPVPQRMNLLVVVLVLQSCVCGEPQEGRPQFTFKL